MNRIIGNTRWKCAVLLFLPLVLALSACGVESTPTPLPPTEVVEAATSSDVAVGSGVSVGGTGALVATQVVDEETAVAPTATNAPTDTPVSEAPPTDTPTPIPPTDTPEPPTDTPEPTEVPTEEASPTPEATNTPVIKPTTPPQPKTGKILFTSNRASWDDIFVMNDDGSNVKRLTTMGKCYDAHFSPDAKSVVFTHSEGQLPDIWKVGADGGGLTNLTDTTDNIEAYPVVSPDGKRIAYLFGWPGGFEIYTMKLDGTDRKPITSRELDLEPTWSPDSQKIAFSSLRGGNFNIWIVNRDGSDLKQVTKFGPERIAQSPVFAPNGKQIAFSTIAQGTAWEIWVVGVDGSNPHKVVGTVGSDRNNSTFIAAWKQGKFLIGGYQGRWDPYFVAEGGGEPSRVPASEKDDKPSDWWLP